jgi:magnesium chelatase family protein
MCKCTPASIAGFKKKLSAPILNRIDLKVLVSSFDLHAGDEYDYATVTIRSRIQRAREIQQKRYPKGDPRRAFITCNAEVPDKSQFAWDIDRNAEAHFERVYQDLNVSTKRTEVKIHLVARTVADLDSSERISRKHIDAAVDLMGLKEDYFRDLFSR